MGLVKAKIMKKKPRKQNTKKQIRLEIKHGLASNYEVQSSLTSNIDCLPKEIIGDVLGRVAASSAIDLVHCKLSCTALNEISEEKYVLQQVSIDNLITHWWRTERMHCFIAKCLESNNSEAFLYVGLRQYFSYMMLDDGLKNLEISAHLGNNVATYVLGLIFLCSVEEEHMKRGGELLIKTMKMIKGKGIVECRKKFNFHRRLFWFDNKLISETVPVINCEMKKEHMNVKLWWGDYYDEECEDSLVCDVCKCAREVEFFKSML